MVYLSGQLLLFPELDYYSQYYCAIAETTSKCYREPIRDISIKGIWKITNSLK